MNRLGLDLSGPSHEVALEEWAVVSVEKNGFDEWGPWGVETPGASNRI